jgi:methionine aminopeptidase
MSIESSADFDGITRAGRVVAEALSAMVRESRPGMTTRDLDEIGAAVLKCHGIGRAVEQEVSARGFHVLRELSGHGVGRTIHEAPTVPNYFDPFQRDVLTEGLVLTIEPLISERRTRIRADDDGWTLRTANGCLAAHHEHTIIVTTGNPLIITTL